MSAVFDDSEFRKLTSNLKDLSPDVMKEAFKEFVEITPVDKGNAKRRTKLKDDTIEADYPYAFVLDEGRKRVNGKMQGSKQAPKGMTGPTIDQLEKLVDKQVKKAGG